MGFGESEESEETWNTEISIRPEFIKCHENQAIAIDIV
jgi:hypothetical protein